MAVALVALSIGLVLDPDDIRLFWGIFALAAVFATAFSATAFAVLATALSAFTSLATYAARAGLRAERTHFGAGLLDEVVQHLHVALLLSDGLGAEDDGAEADQDGDLGVVHDVSHLTLRSVVAKGADE